LHEIPEIDRINFSFEMETGTSFSYTAISFVETPNFCLDDTREPVIYFIDELRPDCS
jgi:hypothetical protein